MAVGAGPGAHLLPAGRGRAVHVRHRVEHAADVVGDGDGLHAAVGVGEVDQFRESCLRCPMLNINPKMLHRLDEIEADLLARRARAEAESWLGEVEGIDLTLTFLRQKREDTRRLAHVAPVGLGMPGIRLPRRAGRSPVR